VRGHRARVDAVTDQAVTTLAGQVGIRVRPRALSVAEPADILDVHSDRFADLAPAGVWATLLDEGVYLGSQSRFYLLLRGAEQVRERRREATHPAAVKPELVETGPNQVWVVGHHQAVRPTEWTYFHHYLILDILPRHAVGCIIASRESAVLTAMPASRLPSCFCATLLVWIE